MNKRGNERTEVYIIKLVIFLIIVISLLNLASKVKEDSLYQQRFTAIETSLIKDTILSSPSDLIVEYSPGKFSYLFKANPCSVSVSTTEDLTSASFYSCINNKLNEEDINLKSKEKIIFEKKESLTIK